MLKDFFSDLDDSYNYWHFDLGGNNWGAMTFTATSSYPLTSIVIPCLGDGSLGTVTVSIRNTTDNKPSGNDLCSGTVNGDLISTSSPYEGIVVSLGVGTNIVEGNVYAIIVRSVTTKLRWESRLRASTNGAMYAGGRQCTSSDGGVTWTATTYDCFFELHSAGDVYITGSTTMIFTASGTLTVIPEVLPSVAEYQMNWPRDRMLAFPSYSSESVYSWETSLWDYDLDILIKSGGRYQQSILVFSWDANNFGVIMFGGG